MFYEDLDAVYRSQVIDADTCSDAPLVSWYFFPRTLVRENEQSVRGAHFFAFGQWNFLLRWVEIVSTKTLVVVLYPTEGEVKAIANQSTLIFTGNRKRAF